MRHQRNTEGLRNNAQKKRLETIQRTEAAIRQLIKAGGPVNFQVVSKAGKVSTAWLYREPGIRSRVLFLRELSQPKQTLPSEQRASDASKDAMNQTLRERVIGLQAENQSLHFQLELAHGSAIPELNGVIEDLQQKNQELRRQIVSITQQLNAAKTDAEILQFPLFRRINQTFDLYKTLAYKVLKLERRMERLQARILAGAPLDPVELLTLLQYQRQV